MYEERFLVLKFDPLFSMRLVNSSTKRAKGCEVQNYVSIFERN